MSAIVFTQRGGACGICLEEFSSGEKQYTHEGGNHDGFHKNCLKEWLNIQRKCPYDGQNIDPKSLISRTQKVMRMLKAPLQNAAHAAAIGAAIGGFVATIAARGLGRTAAAGAVVASAGLGVVTGALGGAVAGREAVGVAVAVAAVVAGGLAGPVALEVAGRARAGAVVAAAAGVLAGALAGGGALILGDCIERILERRGVDVWARAIIGCAICAGGFATEELAQYADRITAIIGGSLTGGCVAGILSMLRGYRER